MLEIFNLLQSSKKGRSGTRHLKVEMSCNRTLLPRCSSKFTQPACEELCNSVYDDEAGDVVCVVSWS